MRKIFDTIGDGWPICWTGQDEQGEHHSVIMTKINGSSAYQYTRRAEGDAELIARLLNWYYDDPAKADEIIGKDEER